MNGGTCDNRIGSFVCHCASGYNGTTCSIGTSHIVEHASNSRCRVLFFVCGKFDHVAYAIVCIDAIEWNNAAHEFNFFFKS